MCRVPVHRRSVFPYPSPSFVRPSDSSWSWSKEGLYSNIFTLARQHHPPSPHAHSHSRLHSIPVQSNPSLKLHVVFISCIHFRFLSSAFLFVCVYVLHIHICLCIRPAPAPAPDCLCLLYHTVTASVVVHSVHVRTESVPITNRRSSYRLQPLVPRISTDVRPYPSHSTLCCRCEVIAMRVVLSKGLSSSEVPVLFADV